MNNFIICLLFICFSREIFSTNILTVSFQKNGTPWLDPIMDAIRTDLSASRSNLNFISVYFDENDNFVNNQINLQKPDICFFPDFYLAEKFHSECKKIGAEIVYISNTKPNIELDKSYSGIYIDFPANKSFEIINSIKNLKKIGVIGGSWLGAKFIAEDIKKKISNKSNVDVFLTPNWKDYKKKLKEWEITLDAIWILIPFGVFDENKVEICHDIFTNFIAEIKIPTIGFGSVVKGGIKRTFNIGPDPKKLGKYAAAVIYGVIKGEQQKLYRFMEIEFVIDKDNLKKIGLDKKMPIGFEHFLR